jgi:hypothetical protein
VHTHSTQQYKQIVHHTDEIRYTELINISSWKQRYSYYKQLPFWRDVYSVHSPCLLSIDKGKTQVRGSETLVEHLP